MGSHSGRFEADALLLEEEAMRRARDDVRRVKLNPKTGEPYIVAILVLDVWVVHRKVDMFQCSQRGAGVPLPKVTLGSELRGGDH